MGDGLFLFLAGGLGEVKLKGPIAEPLNRHVMMSCPDADGGLKLWLRHWVGPHCCCCLKANCAALLLQEVAVTQRQAKK